MANDSYLFKTKTELEKAGFEINGSRFSQNAECYVPLYEAKMIYLYNHRHGDFRNTPNGKRAHILPSVSDQELKDSKYETLPYYWVPEEAVNQRLDDKHWKFNWLIGWRDVTDARASARTLIASIIPRVGVNDKFLLMLPSTGAIQAAALVANLCSLVCDYVARQKVGGLALKYFTMKQLPILPPESYGPEDLSFLVPRVLELTYNSNSMAAFARDLGYDGRSFAWDEDRRACLRADLDAFYARAYRLTRDELCYILDPTDVKGNDYPSETFRVLKEKEIRQYSEYRTRRLVLEAWDRMEGDGTFKGLGR